METNSQLLVQTLTPVVEVLERLNIPYHIGGSVASSLYGAFRPTQDVGLVADLHLTQVRPFVKSLENDYYVVEDSVRDAIRHRSSFNLISNVTFMKVDIFIPKLRAFDQDALQRVQTLPLQGGGREFVVAAPEATIVHKLEWYEMGGRVSGRQWSDIVGVLKQQVGLLDLAYLDRWTALLGVHDLLEQALKEAGIRPQE
ncbi:MAG TPA: hypothetical protein VFA10_12945 [Ktedonobacteraceae bacterium]|nr:hypothetical protein [Ktedonobacteraceae bacterium]